MIRKMIEYIDGCAARHQGLHPFRISILIGDNFKNIIIAVRAGERTQRQNPARRQISQH